MNIKTIKSIGVAALLGTALNGSSFAGPAPRPAPFQPSHPARQGSGQTVVETPKRASTSIALTGHGISQRTPHKPIFVSTPHGTITVLL